MTFILWTSNRGSARAEVYETVADAVEAFVIDYFSDWPSALICIEDVAKGVLPAEQVMALVTAEQDAYNEREDEQAEADAKAVRWLSFIRLPDEVGGEWTNIGWDRSEEAVQRSLDRYPISLDRKRIETRGP